jgi:hypothetical protein
LARINRKKFRKELGKSLAGSIIRDKLEGIQRVGGWDGLLNIVPRIHRMMLSSPYQYNELKQQIGKLKLDNSFKPDDRMPNYNKKYIRNCPGFLVIIFTNRKEPFLPPSMMFLYPRKDIEIDDYKGFLLWLDSVLPGLKVSSVEYANDQFCKDHHSVREVFGVEKRNLFIPYKKIARLYGPNFAKIDKNIILNAVFEAGDTKVYERGLDKNKVGLGWPEDKLDRVRLEYTASRTKLTKNGINTLKDFIDDPNFFRLNKYIYYFRFFDGSNKLPKICDGYPNEDMNGNCGMFQLECFFYKKIISNFNQYVKNVPEFDELLSRLKDVWKEFDEKWKSTQIVPLLI